MTDDRHLSEITTEWSIVRGAADPARPDRQTAQRRLLEIYSDSIRSYLLACLKDQSAADEVYQNFALKLVRGDFVTADPGKGRFRAFVKTVLYRLMINHHRSRKKHGHGNEPPLELAEDRTDVPDKADVEFQRHWREGLLNYAWNCLEMDQSTRGGVCFLLLIARAKRPEIKHAELADLIEQRSGERPSAGTLRVTLHRARQKFADYLVEAVAASLNVRSAKNLDDELIALDLMKYCSEALTRRNPADQTHSDP